VSPAPQALRDAAGVLGAAGVFWTFASVVVTVLTPRVQPSVLALGAGRFARWLVVRVSRAVSRTYATQDRILAFMAPAVLLTQLAGWLVMATASWTLLAWPFTHFSLWATLRDVIISALTLGLAHGVKGLAVPISFAAAASGPLIVAVQIAYFPTLYQAFNRREALVTLLGGRAGSPPWGPEILRRYWSFALSDRLPTFYEEWERWAAEVLESHSSYRALILFRSPTPWRSWSVSLLAVLDSAAMLHATSPSSTPSQARLCLQMGAECFRGLAVAFHLPYDQDPDPDTTEIFLTYQEFLVGYETVRKAGLPIERDPEEAWRHFRGWRVNYERAAFAIANWVLAVPAPWSGPRRDLVAKVGLPAPVVHRAPGGKRYVEPRIEEPPGPGSAPSVGPPAGLG